MFKAALVLCFPRCYKVIWPHRQRLISYYIPRLGQKSCHLCLFESLFELYHSNHKYWKILSSLCFGTLIPQGRLEITWWCSWNYRITHCKNGSVGFPVSSHRNKLTGILKKVVSFLNLPDKLSCGSNEIRSILSISLVEAQENNKNVCFLQTALPEDSVTCIFLIYTAL